MVCSNCVKFFSFIYFPRVLPYYKCLYKNCQDPLLTNYIKALPQEKFLYNLWKDINLIRLGETL